jgi:hypothetical protein
MAPSPGWLAASILPPWSLTMALAMAWPNPLRPWLITAAKALENGGQRVSEESEIKLQLPAVRCILSVHCDFGCG